MLSQWRCAGVGPPRVRLPNRAIRYREEDVNAWAAVRTDEKGHKALALAVQEAKRKKRNAADRERYRRKKAEAKT